MIASPIVLARCAAAGFLSALLIGQASARGGDAPPSCTGIGDVTAAQLWQGVTASPAYTLLRRSLGAPTSCKTSRDESRQSIVVSFPRDGSLTLSNDTTLESSSLQAVLPPSARLSRNKAIRVLRAVERHAAAPDGCGVAWSKLTDKIRAPATDAEAEGTHCNCKARLGTDRRHVVRLGFSLAC